MYCGKTVEKKYIKKKKNIKSTRNLFNFNFAIGNV